MTTRVITELSIVSCLPSGASAGRCAPHSMQEAVRCSPDTLFAAARQVCTLHVHEREVYCVTVAQARMHLGVPAPRASQSKSVARTARRVRACGGLHVHQREVYCVVGAQAVHVLQQLRVRLHRRKGWGRDDQLDTRHQRVLAAMSWRVDMCNCQEELSQLRGPPAHARRARRGCSTSTSNKQVLATYWYRNWCCGAGMSQPIHSTTLRWTALLVQRQHDKACNGRLEAAKRAEVCWYSQLPQVSTRCKDVLLPVSTTQQHAARHDCMSSHDCMMQCTRQKGRCGM
jgi:hypothetical protein